MAHPAQVTNRTGGTIAYGNSVGPQALGLLAQFGASTVTTPVPVRSSSFLEDR
jgi:hypothetical protein